MATIIKTTSKPTPGSGRDRLSNPKGMHAGGASRSPAESRREAAKLRDFRAELSQRRSPEETTARTSLFGGRRNE